MEKRGIEKGIEKGRKEEKIGIAQNLLSQGIDLDAIIKATGLSKEELEKLKH